MNKQVEQKIMSTHEHKRNEREKKTGENTLIQFEFRKRRGSNFVKEGKGKACH